MQYAVETAKRQCIAHGTRKTGCRNGAVDHDGAHGNARAGKLARKITGTIITGEIKKRFAVMRHGNVRAHEPDEVSLIAVRRDHLGEAGRARGFGRAPPDDEDRQRAQLGNAGMRGDRA